MYVVNLFGPPGAGKSTGAAYIFSRLKMAGVNCELVTEFAKDKVWENNEAALSNQVYILGEQLFKLTKCENQVDFIVTDSPLINSCFYNKNKTLGKHFSGLVIDLFNNYENINYFVNRTKPYVQAGRLQNEAESDKAGKDIKELLDKFKINYSVYDGDIKSYDQIANEILVIAKAHNLIADKIAILDPFKDKK